MIRLKGAHFLTAFLMGVLFPVFLGAAELPTYQKYEGPIKPGVVITKENWDQYLPELQKLLQASQLHWCQLGVKEGLVTMPVLKTTYPGFGDRHLEASRKNAGKAHIGPDNQLYDFVAGVPFPEPKSAAEIIWNAYPMLPEFTSPEDFHMYHAYFGLFSGTKYEKNFTWTHFLRKYRGRTQMPPLGDLPEFTDRGIVSRESLFIKEPNEVKGFIQLRIRYWDINKDDDTYAYIPAIRRIRRLTGNDLTDPLLGSDATPDDFEIWRQKLNSIMKFRVLEHRDFLVPRTVIASKPEKYDPKKHGPCFQSEWEIRPTWVVEVSINNPDYLYSKRVLFIDAVPLYQGGKYSLNVGENYDQNGRLFKSITMNTGRGITGLGGPHTAVFINLLSGHLTSMDLFIAQTQWDESQMRQIFPLNEEVFTIKGLMRRAR
ncbi:MAG TPA: DUF1329 domain-containing protein [Syntrophales bacterium]|nr:DUF1329 domain-containing protein [Syntrophales bacterium]